MILPQRHFAYDHCSPEIRLSFRKFTLSLQQGCKVVQRRRHLVVIGTKRRFPNFECALIEWFRLYEVSFCLKLISKVV